MSMARAVAFNLFLANICPHKIFHGHEQGKSRAITGQEQNGNRAGAGQKHGRSRSCKSLFSNPKNVFKKSLNKDCRS